MSRNADDNRVAGFYFLDIRQRFFVDRFLSGKRNDGYAFDDKRKCAVLEFARRVGLRVNVRNFLELERAFQSNVVVKRTPDIKNILVETVLPCESFNRLHVRKRFGNLRGNFFEQVNQSANFFVGQRAQNLSHVQRKHEHQN